MSITARQNKIPFTLTASTTNYVLGSHNTTVAEGIPLNRAAIWRVTIDNTASAIDLTFTLEVMAKFEGTWAYVESFVVPAGLVRTFERTVHGWAVRLYTNPGLAIGVVTSVEFQATSS